MSQTITGLTHILRRSFPQTATAVLALLVSAFAAPDALSARFALIGAEVHTNQGNLPLQSATVLIEDGRIRAVGNDISVPDGYERLDVSGKVITPGIIEPYSLLGLREIELEPSTNDGQLVNLPRRGPGFDVAPAFNPASTLLGVARVEGVTRAIVAPVPGVEPFAGWGATATLKETNPTIVQPRMGLFVALNGASLYGGSRAATVQRVRQALADAGSYRPGRFDTQHYSYAPEAMAALRDFHRSNAPLAILVDRAVEIDRALELASAFDRKLILIGAGEGWKRAEAIAAANAAVVLDGFANVPRDFDKLGARSDNAPLLHAAGVQVAFTAEDAHNARTLRQMAGNAVAHGMPWHAALNAITRTPARMWGMNDVGEIAPGQVADLVVWNGDPLEVSTWAERVMIDGTWQSARSRQTRLLERYRPGNSALPHGYR